MPTEIKGQIETITYANEESGFTIARVKVGGEKEQVTIVGNLMALAPGEVLKMQGEWSNHPKFGRQFKVEQYQTEVPATVEGIRKYLGSGFIKGLGPVMAQRIVRQFGKNTLETIENQAEKLAEVEGVGPKRITMIKQAWQEQKAIRHVMLFLQSHGVGSGYAVKIFKQYGNNSIAVVKENPYRLASDIFGMGFIIADRIAGQLGFARNSEVRAAAGVLYILNKLAEEGNVYYPYEPLLEKSGEILQVERDIITKALGSMTMEGKIIMEDLNEELEEFQPNHKAVYLKKLHASETGIAGRLEALIKASRTIRRVDMDQAITRVQKQLAITLDGQQAEAVKSSLENKVMVITGGPGTGKTTIINAVLKIYSRMEVRIMLAAPTGRAAKRLSEAAGREARTIHRLLEFSFKQGGFQRHESRLLECDLLIIDEASMIDTLLMHQLLKAVPAAATFILVGDVNQLPSVGPGNVLNDIIGSGAVPVVKLSKIFRQARASQIVVNAHRINNGVLPQYDPSLPENDFYFIAQEDPEQVLKTITELVQSRIPRRFGFDPVDDIQVLTPMHKGVVGTVNLNRELQKTLNPREDGVVRGESIYRVNDKVMQIKNNYDKEVFNGDIGRIARICPEDKEITVVFDHRKVIYDFADLDEIILAYAISVHKSQGSEYAAVIIPVLTQHYLLLQRNLIYTAITRGRKLVVMVGTRKALAMAVKNDKTRKRYTYLKYRLK